MQCSRLPNRNGVTLSDSSHQPLLARSLLLPYLGPCASSVLRQARVVAVFYVMLCLPHINATYLLG